MYPCLGWLHLTWSKTPMIREGTRVQWTWGNGTADGTVKSTFTETLSFEIDSSTISRQGESGNKALLIVQDDGQRVLKLESECKRADG